MDRRTFLAFGGTSAAAALAGCNGDLSGGTGDDPPPTDDDDNNDDNEEGDQLNNEPLPGDGYVDELVSVDNSTVKVRLANVDWPRKVTLELYAQVATEDTPAGEWAYDTNGDIRPILNYESDNEQLISEKIVESSTGDEEVVTFEHEEMPAGVPVQYQVYLREHLHSENLEEGDTSGGPRRHAGTTQQVVRDPGEDEYTVAPGEGDERVDLGEDEYTHHEDDDGNHTVTVIASTNNTRFHTPLHDEILNRDPEKTGLGGLNGHKRGAFERLWGIEYTVTADEFELAHEHNKTNYGGPYSQNEGWAINRMYRDYLHGAEENGADETIEPIRRIAEKFATRAEQLGYTTPEEKVRFLMDFVQWMPYETDRERNERNVPQVQHPTVTLARCQGDCEDKTILLAALLYQDPFPDYVMHMYFWSNEAVNLQAHRGLAIKNDIFTVDTGGPTANNLDDINHMDVEPGDYTYIEATSPAALGKCNDGFTGLSFETRDFPGY